MPACSRRRGRSCSIFSWCRQGTASCSKWPRLRPPSSCSGSASISLRAAGRDRRGAGLRGSRGLGRAGPASRRRHSPMPTRGCRRSGSASCFPLARVSAISAATHAGEDEYHAHRIALGVPEGGRDYAFGDAFPHEAMFDQLTASISTKAASSVRRSCRAWSIAARRGNASSAWRARRPLPPSGTEHHGRRRIRSARSAR